MPTLRKDKGNCWWARVIVDGRQVDSKFFPPGRKKGPEWTAAKAWEVKTKAEIEEMLKQGAALQLQRGMPTPILTALERLLGWGEAYLAHVQRTMSTGTLDEKKLAMKDFFAFCDKEGVCALEDVTPAQAYAYLAGVFDARGGNAANKDRKNLMAAWAWGVDFVEGFPQVIAPFAKVKAFPTVKKPRYVPPEEDVVKVLQQVTGQDLVMLLTYYFTGARRGEILKLSWSQDVRLETGKIRLTDNKAGNGQTRERWLQMPLELVKALTWWWYARPCMVDNVFMQVHCDAAMGQPFKFRRHLMKNLCGRAGVKHFGFHAIRHKSAAITFVAQGLNSAQILLGHSRATTTDTYVQSAGLYTDQGAILTALCGSGIGQAVGGLLEKIFPQEDALPGGNCNPEYVTQ